MTGPIHNVKGSDKLFPPKSYKYIHWLFNQQWTKKDSEVILTVIFDSEVIKFLFVKGMSTELKVFFKYLAGV